MDLNKIISSCDIQGDPQRIQHAQQNSSFLTVNVILIILTLTVQEKNWGMDAMLVKQNNFNTVCYLVFVFSSVWLNIYLASHTSKLVTAWEKTAIVTAEEKISIWGKSHP